MKKWMIGCLVVTVGIAASVHAQSIGGPTPYRKTAVFSPALFSSDLWNKRSSGTTGPTSSSSGSYVPQTRRVYVLKYEGDTIELNEAQKQQLLQTVVHIKNRTTGKLQFVAGSEKERVGARRIQAVLTFLNANNDSGNSFKYSTRVIPIEALTRDTVNTVKIIETN